MERATLSQLKTLNLGPSAITIGNFDGCHLGHQDLIRENIQFSLSQKTNKIVLSFHPKPKDFFLNNKNTCFDIFTANQKSKALYEMGIDKHIVLEFNDELHHTSHEDFYKNYLVDTMKARQIVVGSDFRFGYQRLGTASWLKERAKKDSILVTVVEARQYNNKPISSSRIRQIINKEGDTEQASKMLGHNFVLEGITKKGDQIGRSIGFPTINLGEIHQIELKHGVYSGYVWLENICQENDYQIMQADYSKLLPAVFNVGSRPSFESKEIRVEAHIIKDISSYKDIYNHKAAFYFAKRLRSIEKFSNISLLKQAIQKDIDTAKDHLL